MKSFFFLNIIDSAFVRANVICFPVWSTTDSASNSKETEFGQFPLREEVMKYLFFFGHPFIIRIWVAWHRESFCFINWGFSLSSKPLRLWVCSPLPHKALSEHLSVLCLQICLFCAFYIKWNHTICKLLHLDYFI